ncbi:hypothetical protein MO973_45000 [Paenibacillus sp. TRM 82003]|uniref:hypothetical protein n=1 Tax=Kineococcus sp. TRM81007 TaxID=2925831 RepID=UPI001F579139|nr:hypothetical protein [Kineococcus sp. TRM81007]MCI2238693.1 hypothetical protein [Kineococcus sp. TRM81007]MCI3927355.1 hypothetical protein [Paenibacillus sp. TRM 82003]
MRTTAAGLTAAALIGLLAGCSATTEDVSSPDVTISVPSEASSAIASASGEADAALDAATEAAEGAGDRLAGLAAAVQPELAADAEQLQQRAEEVCADIEQGTDEATVTSNTQQLFSGGDVGQLTEQQAQELVDAIRSTVCP